MLRTWLVTAIGRTRVCYPTRLGFVSRQTSSFYLRSYSSWEVSMTFIKSISAGTFALASAAMFAMPANATPLSIAGSENIAKLPQSESSLVHKVSGCHPNLANHMVYKWGYQALHRHGQGCTPIPAYPVPAYPPSYVPGPNYGGGNYCHRNWKNHYHTSLGGGWHNHVGPNCNPHKGRRWKGGSKQNCLNLGGIWICG